MECHLVDRADLARQAYIWGFPLVQHRLYIDLARRNGLDFNQLATSSAPSSPDTPASPTVDVVYGLAWFDLKAEPIVLSVPDTSDRYYAIQMMDAYFNTFDYVGRRTTGTQAGHFAIVGPRWDGVLPAGLTRIAAPTNHGMLMMRTRVIDPDDFQSAVAIQGSFRLSPLSKFPAMGLPTLFVRDALTTYYPIVHPKELGIRFFDELGEALAESPPPACDRAFVATLDAIGVGPGRKPSSSRDPELAAILSEAVLSTDSYIRSLPINAKNSVTVNGWSINYTITGYLTDPLDRAVLCSTTPGAQVNKELLYFWVFNLPGNQNYVLHFDARELPQVDAFWSLTVSGTDWFLIKNSIDRYSINDRTPGLRWGDDGSLTIYIQRDVPEAGPSNWLPISDKPFSVFLRMYQAKQTTLEGTYIPPPLRKAQAAGVGRT